MHRLLALALPVLLSPLSPAQQAAAPERRENPVPLERPLIYRVDEQSQDLTILDIDGDGRRDILAVNNANGTIDLFYGMTESQAAAASPDAESDMPPERIHVKAELITGRQVDQLAAGDIDGDGLADIAVGSERGGGAVFFQSEPRTFETARRLRAPARHVLVTDWDTDGRPELLVTATRERPARVALVTAGEDRTLTTRWTVPLTSMPSDAPRLADWNDDGFQDLLWLSRESSRVHVLFNDGQGAAGGETVIEVGAALDWAPFAISGRMGLLTLESASGIARLLAPAEPLSSVSAAAFGSPQRVALPQSDAADQISLLAGSLGEGPEAVYLPVRGGAEALLVRSDAARSLRRHAPSALNEVDSAQRLSDGRLVLISRAEGTVALAPPPGAQSVPPQPLPVALRPLAAAGGELDAAPGLDLLVIGRDSSDALVTQVFSGLLSGQAASAETLRLPGFASDDPSSIWVGDVNGDGAEDMTLFYQYRPPAVYVTSQPGSWESLDSRFRIPPTFFEGVGPNQLWVGDLNGDGSPQMLLARAGLVRILSLTSPPNPQVRGQIVVDRPGAQIVAVCALARSTGRPPMIFALDRVSGIVSVAAPGADGQWEVIGEVETDLDSPQRLAVGDWDGDGITDLAAKGAGAVVLLFGGVTHPPLEQLATLGSPLDDGRFGRVETLAWGASGLLAHLTDHRHHVLFAHRWRGAEGGLEELWRFQVFETVNERRGDWDRSLSEITVEPRELAVGDLDEDGLDDLALLSHEHLLIYRGRH
ncbi:MAG: VCBS repeat-containing protein [Candidatus Sumerlaeia bacterium]|nr:VCBS repeat-containing protein [Candidatus Sumerlaeia bacterium]